MARFHISNILFILTLLFATLLLQACETGGGYGSPWDFSNTQEAVRSPNNLSTVYSQRSTANQGDDTLSSRDYIVTRDPNQNAQGRAPMDADGQDQLQQQAQAQQPVKEQTVRSAPVANLPPVKVGILLPLSGNQAQLGQAMLQAAQMALFDVGHNSFELLPRDTQGTSQGGRDAAQSAINEGAQFLIGPVFSDAVRGARNIANRNNVNMVAFSTDWSLAGGNTFLMGFMPFDQIARVMTYAYTEGYMNFGVLAPNTEYGNAVLSSYNTLALQLGLNTVETSRFSERSTNLSPIMRSFAKYDDRLEVTIVDGEEVENVLDPHYDAILVAAGGDTARALANLASQYDMSPRVVKRLGTGLWDDIGLASEPSLSGSWFAAPSPNLRAGFERRYKNLYAKAPPRLSTLAYDATALAAILAQKGLREQSQPAFDRASLTNPNGFAGIDGIFRFQSNGLVERGLAILEFRSGRIKIIDEAPRTFQTRRAR